MNVDTCTLQGKLAACADSLLCLLKTTTISTRAAPRELGSCFLPTIQVTPEPQSYSVAPGIDSSSRCFSHQAKFLRRNRCNCMPIAVSAL